MPAVRSRSVYEDSARSDPLTSAPRRRQTSARPLMPAPPIAMKCRTRPLNACSAIRSPQHLLRDSPGRIRFGKPPCGDAHLAKAILVREQIGDRAAEAVGGQLDVGDHD